MMAAAAGQRVVVEEPLAVERQAAQRAVVERQLHDVGIAAVALEQQHAMRPEDQADRGAGLGVGGLVGQIVVGGEALVVLAGAEAAGDVEALVGEIGPQPPAGRQQARVAVLAGEIGHGAVEVHGAHGVSDDVDRCSRTGTCDWL